MRNRNRQRKQWNLPRIGVFAAALFLGIMLGKAVCDTHWVQDRCRVWLSNGCKTLITYFNVAENPIRSYVMGSEAGFWDSEAVRQEISSPIQQYLMQYGEDEDFWQKESFWMSAGEEVLLMDAEQSSEQTKEAETKQKTASKTNPQKETASASSNADSANAQTTKGIVLAKKQLSDFNYMISNFYVVSGTTYITKQDVDMLKLSQMDMTLKQTNRKKPQILIYHTHSQEGFTDTVAGDPSTTIIGVGNYLTELLTEKYHYNVIHDTTAYDLVNGKLDRNKAYDYAREKISQILRENPSVEVVLDVHRDGVGENVRLVTQINGKQTAKIMFFNGLSRIQGLGDVDGLYNPYLTENLAMSLQMRLAALKTYPDFVRCNYLNAYKYNLDMRPKAMLIEVGAQTNTLQEELNAMEPLAELLHQVLSP